MTPFEQYLTMGRLESRWKLKEILSPVQGEATMKSEILDEGSGSGQLERSYQHRRPT